jgi:uncharacterized protein YerC
MNSNQQELLSAIVKHLKTEKNFHDFFTDILTPKEYEDFVSRFLLCKELKKGLTVKQVCQKNDVASATVVRGNRILKYGTGIVGRMV